MLKKNFVDLITMKISIKLYLYNRFLLYSMNLIKKSSVRAHTELINMV